MVRDEEIKKYNNMEAPELRMRCIAFETENNILRAQLDSVRRERNALLKKVADISLDSNSSSPNGLGSVPKPLGR